MKTVFQIGMGIYAFLCLTGCKQQCILEGYYQVPSFLSLTPAKETYIIGKDTIHLKVEIPFKNFTLLSGSAINVESNQPSNLYFSVIPITISNGKPDTIISDPIGKGLIDIIYKGTKTNFASRSWDFQKTENSWLFYIDIIPVSDLLKECLILLHTGPIQYKDDCMLLEYPIEPFETNPNWHLPMSFSPNNDYRPYAQDFYFMLK
jgi:hypothetical protein